VHAERISTLVACGAMLALAAGLLDHAWLFDLLAHFRVQYAALLAACALMLAILRRYLRALACVLMCAVTTWSIARYIGSEGPPAGMPGDFRVMSYNVWFRTHGEQPVAEYLERSGADLIVLQELNTARAQHLRSLLPSYPHAYLEAAHPHGTAIFSRWPILTAAPLPLGTGGSRASQVIVRWRDTNVTVLGVHLHWPITPGTYALRNTELDVLASFARAHDGPLLVTGDFNATPWSRHFRHAVDASGLSDCARGHGLLATWPSQFPPLGLRLDHCLVSHHWRTVSVTKGPRLGSDHVATIADLAFLPARNSGSE
jgi:endonuclease/exonuclease/phosphatase (EEP) superfamily protein YafD